MPQITQQHTQNVLAAQLRRDVALGIALLAVEENPLLSLLLARGMRAETINPKFEWSEKDYVAFWTTVAGSGSSVSGTGSYDADDVTIIVADGTLFKIHDVFEVPRTGEHMYVTAVVGNTLTVVRGWGSTAPAALTGGEDVQILGNAMEEGSTKPDAKATVRVMPWNFTQIIRTPINFTDTLRVTGDLAVTDPFLAERTQAGAEHAKRIERAFLFGERHIDTTSYSTATRATGGLYDFISTNVYARNGTMTETQWDTFLRDYVFRYGSTTKLLLASRTLRGVITRYERARKWTTVTDRIGGLSITRWLSDYGELDIVTHRMLRDGAGGQGYAGDGIVVDLPKLRYRFLNGRDTHINENIEDNSEDARVDEFFSDVGLEVGQEKTHAIITGVTGYKSE